MIPDVHHKDQSYSYNNVEEFGAFLTKLTRAGPPVPFMAPIGSSDPYSSLFGTNNNNTNPKIITYFPHTVILDEINEAYLKQSGIDMYVSYVT